MRDKAAVVIAKHQALADVMALGDTVSAVYFRGGCKAMEEKDLPSGRTWIVLRSIEWTAYLLATGDRGAGLTRPLVKEAQKVRRIARQLRKAMGVRSLDWPKIPHENGGE